MLINILSICMYYILWYFFSLENEVEQYEEALSTSRQILSKWRCELLELSLALHAHAPKLEMFRQVALDRGLTNVSVAEKCSENAYADVNGVIICDFKDLKKQVEESLGSSEASPIYDVDHRYPGGENNKVRVILYTQLGTEHFQSSHRALVELVTSGLVDYVLRPYVKDADALPKLRLNGYGVQLAIKSTEYKAQDDSKLEEESGSEVQEDTPVHGFIFNTLKELHPDSHAELAELKEHLKESSHELAPMKVWQLQHLSMQAAVQILAQETPLQMLQHLEHISQNFPRLARSLVKTKVCVYVVVIVYLIFIYS